MYPANELSLADVRYESTLFWSRGNGPTQQTEHLEGQELRLHFIAGYLLADKVVASASFYYESLHTREVTREFAEIFHRGDVLYFVDDSMDSFHAHARRKREKSPRNMGCYRDIELVHRASNELAALRHILRRPDKSVSDEIVKLWSADLLSTEEGSLGWSLAMVCGDQGRFLDARDRLQSLCANRGDKDFVWEFIAPTLLRIGLAPKFRRYAKRRLAQFYSVATGALLGVPIDNALRLGPPTLGPNSRYDTALFLECMGAMRLRQLLATLDVRAIIVLKSSPEFLIFREFYFALIDAATYNHTQLISVLPLYARVERNMPVRGADRETVVSAFGAWCDGMRGQKTKYVLALYKVLDAYDAFGARVIRDLLGVVGMLARPKSDGGEPYRVAQPWSPHATELRNTREQSIVVESGSSLFINYGGIMRDAYNNEGVVGAMGRNAVAHDNVFLQDARRALSEISLTSGDAASVARLAEALASQQIGELGLTERLEGAKYLAALADAVTGRRAQDEPLAGWKGWTKNLGERAQSALSALANVTTIAAPIAKLLGLPI